MVVSPLDQTRGGSISEGHTSPSAGVASAGHGIDPPGAYIHASRLDPRCPSPSGPELDSTSLWVWAPSHP